MLNMSQTIRVFVCTQPADMRRSFDGPCGMAENLTKQSPLSRHLVVFRNRHRDRLKILYWDRGGWAIWYQRLEKGGCQLPTDLKPGGKEQASAEISVDKLPWLLDGVELASVKRRKRDARPNTTR